MRLNANNMWESRYWHPAVTVDAVIFGFEDEELSVLLIKRSPESDAYPDCWALPGGFITQADKSAKDAICRELKEETGIDGIEPIEFQTFSKDGRDPRERVISIAFYALVSKTKYNEIKGGDDAAEAQWHKFCQLPELAFDHEEIIQSAFERLQQSIHFKPIAFRLLDERFTMSQLQSIYIAILMPPLGSNRVRDRRNFAKKMSKQEYIEETEFKETGNPWRAARLYKFNEKKFREVKKKEMRLGY